MLGVHRSTYYRWQRQLVRYGTEILRPRERRRPRMPNAIWPMVEHRLLALALANTGWGPDRLRLELARPKWGALKVSPNGVWRALKCHGLSIRAKRREFRSQEFSAALAALDVEHIYIHAGRPTSNGCVERVQQTLLEECWKPAFARYLTPKYTGLRRDLERELLIYNTDRAHQGRRTQGRTPEQALMDRTPWT